MDEILKLFGNAEQLWAAIWENAEKVGIETTRIMLELFYVMKSPETQTIDKTLIVTALAYQLLPKDVLPRDKFGLLGFLDNVATLGFAYNKVKSSVTPQIENQVNNILTQWFGSEQETNPTGNWIPSPEPQQQPAQPFFNPGQSQVPHNPHHSSGNYQRPIWNDDEDVVID